MRAPRGEVYDFRGERRAQPAVTQSERVRKGLSEKPARGGMVSEVYHAMLLNNVNKNVVMGSLISPSCTSKVDVQQSDHGKEVTVSEVQFRGCAAGLSAAR
jgi:hypothetical protein